MSYQKQNFRDGDVLTAAQLNHIEEGLAVLIGAVGIRSIRQTTTSTTDGGINVITVTLTDGKETTFNIRNGSKGSQGGTIEESVIAEAVRAYLAENEISSGAKISEVTLAANAWQGTGNLYSQEVTIAGVTAYSQVDLTPSVEQLAVFYEKDLTFVTENDGGLVTVYAIGQKPQNDYTIQVTITEVAYV